MIEVWPKDMNKRVGIKEYLELGIFKNKADMTRQCSTLAIRDYARKGYRDRPLKLTDMYVVLK